MIYFSKKQVGDSADDATCRGFDFAMTVDDVVFQVRSYVDRPGEFTVINPDMVKKSRQVRQLVDYLVSALGGQRMFFFDGRSKIFREVDLQTLKFKLGDASAFQPGPETIPKHTSDFAIKDLRLVSA